MSNYRALFERLAKCNLPADVSLNLDGWVYFDVGNANGHHVFTWDHAWECRAALMLIVDALENGTEVRFSRDRVMHTTHLHVPVTLKYRCRIGVFEAISPDEVTAIAECLIAALGVAG